MYAFAFHLEDLGVAALADLVSRISNRKRSDLGDCRAPVMSILSKTPWHQETPHDQKQDDSCQEDGCQTEEVFRIFEAFHKRQIFQAAW